jgi:LacI family transcriptional regulator
MPPMRPTIADVAQQASVSISTVSRVLNGTAPVDIQTAERVREIIAELNYTPHSAARNLASQRTDTIGLLVPQISGSFFQPLLRGIEAGARQYGYSLLIHTTHYLQAESAPRKPLAEHNTDGLLVFTGSLDAKELTRLNQNGFPVVLLHQASPEGVSIPVVTIENRAGARQIVEHLIEVHHRRRIAFLQGSAGHEDSLGREQGYREALQANGISFDPTLVGRGEFDRIKSRQIIDGLLEKKVNFDAVFTGDDDSAIGVIQALREVGLRIPEDIAIAGFDDQVFAGSLVPPLTTVRAPTEQVGQQAVRQLIRLIHAEPVEVRLVLPTELVLRESCGCSKVG